MIASILIIIFSAVLFIYWFRYTCLLILSTKTAKDYTSLVASANQLQLLETQETLRMGVEPARLDGILSSIENDYRVLTSLLRHAAELQIGAYNIEQRMLMIDFACMKLWYGVCRRFSESQAHHSLDEMSSIVAHFANAMGERGAATGRS